MVRAQIERFDSDGRLQLSTTVPDQSGDMAPKTLTFTSDPHSVEPIRDDSQLHTFTKKHVTDLLVVEDWPVDKTPIQG